MVFNLGSLDVDEHAGELGQHLLALDGLDTLLGRPLGPHIPVSDRKVVEQELVIGELVAEFLPSFFSLLLGEDGDFELERGDGSGGALVEEGLGLGAEGGLLAGPGEALLGLQEGYLFFQL